MPEPGSDSRHMTTLDMSNFYELSQRWQLAKRLPVFALLLAAVLVATSAFNAVMSWRHSSGTMADGDEQPGGQAPLVPVRARIFHRDIASMHLFGKAKTSGTASKVPTVAPDTRLKLLLKGVVASKDGKGDPRAIVSDTSGKKQKVYAVGDKLPGGAEIKEIYPDRIILIRAGQYETLRIIRKKALKTNSL